MCAEINFYTMKHSILYTFILVFLFPLHVLSQDIDAESQMYIDSLERSLSKATKEERIKIMIELISANGLSKEKSYNYGLLAISMSQEIGNGMLEFKARQDLSLVKANNGQFDEGIKLQFECLEMEIVKGDSLLKAQVYRNVGVYYRNKGNYDIAVTYYQKALKNFEIAEDDKNVAGTLLNIGNIYYFYLSFDKYAKALEYYQQSLDAFEIINDTLGMALSKLNISQVYSQRGEYEKALEYSKGLKEIFYEFRKADFYLQTLNNTAGALIELNDFKNAEKMLREAEQFMNDIQFYGYLSFIYGSYGKLYHRSGLYAQAIEYYQKSIEILEEQDRRSEMADIYKDITDVYSKTGNYKTALDYFKLYSTTRDSIFNAETSKQIQELQTKYETDKKEKEIALLTKTQENQRLIQNALIIGSILVILVAFLMYNRYLIKKRANTKLEEVNNEIMHQRDMILEQKQEITDSIHYASRIQSALLPPREQFAMALPQHFILFKPRDIVSGDFYWMAQKGNLVFVAAADCTGHGVPGAFMSMLGISFLNEIVSKNDIRQANEVLNMLRDNIIASLRQTGKANEAKDGMDISMSVFNYEKMQLQYAGAYNSMYLVRNNELSEYKADKMPIGIHFKGQKPFTNNEIDIQLGDVIYLFSDGYADQFGGDDGRKFMSKRFKELLTEINQKPMDEQRNILDVTNEEWKNDTQQIDDILVMGIRISLPELNKPAEALKD